MLGRTHRRRRRVRPRPQVDRASGWLPADTVFEPDKVTRQRRGRALGQPVTGYQIHHGRHRRPADPWITLDDGYGDEARGRRRRPGRSAPACTACSRTTGSGPRSSPRWRPGPGETWTPGGVSFAAAREAQFDRLADALEAHLDMAAVER